jgi:hypothetical protein
MAREPKPVPLDLSEWVTRRHPGYKARFIEAQLVESDIWNGTVYFFDLRKPRLPKYLAHLQVYAFALDQGREPPEWTWEFHSQSTSSAKAAVLRALRKSNFNIK